MSMSTMLSQAFNINLYTCFLKSIPVMLKHQSIKYNLGWLIQNDDFDSLLQIFNSFFVLQEECKGKRCRGPVGHYNDLGCTPEYDENDECCAVQYNCDNVKNKPKNKCYVNGNEYQPGESMKQEDKNPCDGDCICTLGNDNM